MSEYKPTEFDTSVNVTPDHPLKETAWMLASLVAIIIGVYFLLGFTLSIVVSRISPEAESKIWESLHLSQTEFSKTPAGRTAQKEAIQTLLDSLPDSVKPAGYSFKVHIIEDKDLNALALPGGHIALTSGLVDAMDSENALVFTLGHELGHFYNRDHLKALGRFAGTLIMSAVLMGQGSETVDFVSGLVSLTDLAYSRRDEELADSWGIKAVIDYYGHAGGATDLFKLLQAKREIRLPAFLSTHPLDEDRVEALNEIIKRNDYDILPVKPRTWPDPLPETNCARELPAEEPAQEADGETAIEQGICNSEQQPAEH